MKNNFQGRMIRLQEWLAKSGAKDVSAEHRSRTKWHLVFELDGWTHFAFAVHCEDGIDEMIEIDKRFWPWSGWPIDLAGTGTTSHLIFVTEPQTDRVALVTPWSLTQLDSEQPDVHRDGQSYNRFPRGSYSIFDTTIPAESIIQMEEIN